MAVVVLPEGQQRSGKQGGIVWSRNRFGAYVRNRAVPVNPNTDRQVAIRNAVRSLSIRWETLLSQAQRDAWDTYASNVVWKNPLGQDVYLTGLNHFIRSNTQLVVDAFSPNDTAPTIFDIGAAELSLAVAASEATQILTITYDDTPAWAKEDGGHQWFFHGIPQNAARVFFGGPWRRCQRVDGSATTPPTSPTTAPAQWPIAAGQRVWVRSRILRADGRLSEFAQVNFLVAT